MKLVVGKLSKSLDKKNRHYKEGTFLFWSSFKNLNFLVIENVTYNLVVLSKSFNKKDYMYEVYDGNFRIPL